MGVLIEHVGGRPQVRRTKRSSFTARKRQEFLDALALTCNIHRAASFAGVSTSTVHRTRRKDAAFAAQWQGALAIGYDRLEAMALEDGGAGLMLEPDPARADAAGADPAPFDFDKAMRLLAFHRAERKGEDAGRGRRSSHQALRLATREETDAALMKALDAAERRMAKAQPSDG